MTRATQRIASFFLVVLALGAIAGLQYGQDQAGTSFRTERKKAAFAISTPIIPSLTALKVMSLGNPSVVADLLWLQSIQYFGMGSPYGNYPALGKLMLAITALDPKYEYPYEFGLVVLPFMQQTDEAIALGLRAQKELPNNGLLTYYLATDYMLNKKDYRQAAKYFQQAAKEPGSPSAAQDLAGTSLGRLDDSLKDRLVATAFWKTVYENAKNDADREKAKNWYVQMQMVYDLESAASAYHDAHGSYPADLQSLVSDGLIPAVPVSPVGRLFDLDPKTGKVKFDRLDPAAQQ